MNTYTFNDLQILDDPIGLIRRNPSMYLRGAEGAVGEHLAARMLFDLVLLGALPAHVDRLGQWWEISAGKDWLAAPDGKGIDVFVTIVPFPMAGPNSHRSEILLTAFADAVVTSGSDGVHWIKGDPSMTPQPQVRGPNNPGSGRLVAFRVGDTARE
jgi:hypothetical protein